MNELEEILRVHALKYPMMQPCDAVKLIYQNTFGGGHLIKDARQCLEDLLHEYAGIEQDPDAELYEAIGNGFFRVHLRALDANGISPEALFRRFLASAEKQRGDRDGFLEKLSLLRTLTGQGAFCFDRAVLEDYLDAYERQGCPPASHSEIYRRHYAPAYRLISV